MIDKISVRLPDGSVREFAQPVDCTVVASGISGSLVKRAVAARINGVLCDMSAVPQNDDTVEIVTVDSDVGEEILRHSAAHILARAVKELYGIKVQITIGPTIKNGFYYDFDYEGTFSVDDFIRIEERMREIIARNEKFERKVVNRQDAIEYFEKRSEGYKVELIRAIPESNQITMYFHGDFADLCRGPHLPTPGFIKAFKILKVAGAYWRGDSRNKMLQRLYGTAYSNEQKLKDYLDFLDEAEKRDHRKLGRDMQLFHMQEEAPGAVFWHPRGYRIFMTIVSFVRKNQERAGYVEISTPEIMDRSIWEKSGHWDKFADQIYTAAVRDEERVYAVRPMNCPGSVQVFKNGIVSYRQLPMRVAEFGKVYRFEHSGALHGLFRVRGFTQDDAHIYCSEEQVIDECLRMCALLKSMYSAFGFDDVLIKLATRPEKRIGADSVWDKSEDALREALRLIGVKYELNEGEGAFYGPKLEFTLRDVLGRDWQIGTLQVDLNLPERFDLLYTDDDGNRKRPVMLHRTIVGSIERFTGILLEHYSGNLPVWLAPVQVAILSVNDVALGYAHSLYDTICTNGVRALLDTEGDTLGYKIRRYSLEKIPLLAIIGGKEVADSTVSVRRLGASEQYVLGRDEFFTMLMDEVKEPVLQL